MSTLKFIQAQSFSLQSSGASAGDTTITLQSFKMIDGTTNIVTDDLGTQCYGTIEPNNGTQEEAIQFTGVTQNASGTATLTGVSSVGFNSPYTVTSGLSKSHAGGVTFILSNEAAFYGNIKTYIDTAVASGASFADNNTAGITKLSVAPASGSNPIAVGDNDSRIPTTSSSNYINSIVQTSIPYAVAGGTANAITVTLSSSITTLASGSYLNFLVPATNATAVTINVNSLGAKTIKKPFSTSLASGDMLTGQIASAVYNGTSFQLLTPSAKMPIPNTYSTGATWSPSTGLKYVIAEVVGGGGGGGGSSSATTASAGGGGGGYARKLIPVTLLTGSVLVTVGGGGNGSTTTTGATGGSSTFGGFISASGGSGGGSGNSATGGAGGGGSGGDINSYGGGGGGTPSSGNTSAGIGGSSVLGGGGQGNNGGNAGNPYGGGGSGGTGSSNSGGAGAQGITIVTEYYN